MNAPANQTLRTLFENALQRYRDRTALVTADRTLSYETLDSRSSALAAAFIDSGLEPGDKVAVLLSNRPESVLVDLAIIKMGAVRVPLNPMLSSEEIQYILSDSGARAVVCEPEYSDPVAEQATATAAPETVVVVSDDPPDDIPETTVRDYHEMVAGDTSVDPSYRDLEVAPDDPAGLFYTGGTTGKPKGVVYSQHSLVASLYAHLAEFGFDGRDTGLVVTPLSHSAGTFLWANLLGGGRTVVQQGFTPERLLDAVERYGVTWTFVVPTMIYRLLDAPHDSYDCSSLERMLYGAAPIRSDKLEEGLDAFGSVFCQFYGQTEVPNLISVLGRQEHAMAADGRAPERLESAGHPCLMAEVRIVDPDTGTELDAGEVGEVLATAPYAFERYHNRPEATAETLEDGWVATGDIGRLDDDRYLYLLDRKHDVVVSGGLNVYSYTVENVLTAHPGVDQAVVFGIPDETWGEAVHAVVVPASASVTEQELQRHASEHLADYEQPKSISFADSLPTTSHGKVDKAALRDPYWEDRDRSIN